MLGVWQCRWGWLQLTLPLAPWGVVALVVSASPPVAGPVLSLDRSVTCICPLWGCCFDAWIGSTEASAAPKTPQNWRIEPCWLSACDSHKDTLSACLVDHLGTALEYRTIANTPTGHRQLIDWAHTTNAARVAVEGSGTFGRPAAVAAMAAGLDIREVPPQLTARLRRRGRTQTKTDQVDAWVIARVALGDNTLAPPTFWEDTEDLRVLVSYRRELVEDRTAGANRLHADLGKLRPGYHQNIPRLTIRQSLDQAMKLLWRDTTPHARVAKQRIRRLRQLDTEIKELTTEIAELVTQSGTRLLDLHGVGVLVAATILSEVGNPRRYATKDKFAMANGTAPIEASSGRVVRHRLNRGGNRQINRAIHTAALTQITRKDNEGRRYYQKLITRGKTHRDAIRVLKRRISDRIWTHLQPPKPTPILT